MKKINYEVGYQFPGTKLTFLGEVPKGEFKKRRALFQCECGNTVESAICHVTNQKTIACGCERKLRTKQANTKHGHAPRYESDSGAYRSWKAMHQRVKVNPLYKDVSICSDWFDFANFYRDMGDRPTGHSIERKDNKGSYEPNNCIWATDLTQAANRSTNVYAVINGERKIISEWCRIYGISRYTVSTRMRNGMTPEEAITTPLMRKSKCCNPEHLELVSQKENCRRRDKALKEN